MDNPLGLTVGNALEVAEALEALSGRGDEELLDVSVHVAREMCELAGIAVDPREALRSGAGRQTFERMLAAQGGHLERGLPQAPAAVEVESAGDGYVAGIDALEVGLAAVDIGVGRMRKEDRVDPAAGLTIHAPVGKPVRRGDRLATVHARSEEVGRSVVPRLRDAWRLSDVEVRRPPHVLARVDRNGVSRAD
jgi:thymidine phosphorylase